MTKSYTIEIRRDIIASTDDEARKAAESFAAEVGGYVTAVFDEDWEEIDRLL